MMLESVTDPKEQCLVNYQKGISIWKALSFPAHSLIGLSMISQTDSSSTQRFLRLLQIIVLHNEKNFV